MGRNKTDKKFAKEFGEIITQLRLTSKHSQKAVAAELGLKQSSLSYYESGKGIPPLDLASKIAKYYNVSIDYLVGLTGVSIRETYPSSVLDAVVTLVRIPGTRLHAPMFPSTESPTLTFDADTKIAKILREYYNFIKSKAISLPISEPVDIQIKYYSKLEEEERILLQNLRKYINDSSIIVDDNIEKFLLKYQRKE